MELVTDLSSGRKQFQPEAQKTVEVYFTDGYASTIKFKSKPASFKKMVKLQFDTLVKALAPYADLVPLLSQALTDFTTDAIEFETLQDRLRLIIVCIVELL
jgi:hypothetical protein